jgi:hypothetical protein
VISISVDIECPCGVVVPVPIAIHLSAVHPVDQQRMTCEPDLTDLWAHSFTHTPGPGGPGESIQAAS